MNISVFLSYPQPCNSKQKGFIDRVVTMLHTHGFEPRTLGVTDYDVDVPLRAIRRLMLDSNGLITVAFRRTFIEKGTSRFSSDLPSQVPRSVDGKWITSPWSHIEAAMAYQIGLPVLIFRENGVMDDGILERGVLGTYMPEFDLDGNLDAYLNSPEWNGMIGKWEGYVRSVVDRKGNPPQLY
jgi:hypothetical protein